MAGETSIHIPELHDYCRQFEAIKADVASLIADLDERSFNWRPEQGRWSIGECFAHLNATAELLLPAISLRIESVRERELLASGPLRRTLFSRFFLRFMEPPYRVKIPGPQNLLPAEAPQPLSIVGDFIHLQDQIIAAIKCADGLDLGAVRMNSPFNRPVRLTLAEWFLFLAVHERRHIWQARGCITSPGFPSTQG